MSDTPAEIRLPKLLVQAEAAVLLRRSNGQIQRLRLERKLGYIPGRPVTIDEKDLQHYVTSAKRRRVPRTGKVRTRRGKRTKGPAFEYVPAGGVPGPFVLLTTAEAAVKFGRTPGQIRYLCLRGRIPYIPGAPWLIDEADLASYLDSERAAALAKIPPVPGTPEFDALQEQKASEKMRRRLHAKAVRRKVARILAEMEARAAK